MDKVNSGGPAFPFNEKEGDGTHYHSHNGMTLRDYFAAKAMEPQLRRHSHGGHKTADIAKWAYQMADAMLAARDAP